MSRQNAELGPIFRNGATGNGDSAFSQHFFQGGVRVGLAGRFSSNNFRQNLFCLSIGHGGTCGSFSTKGSGKKEA
jgi:hypothetical protein